MMMKRASVQHLVVLLVTAMMLTLSGCGGGGGDNPGSAQGQSGYTASATTNTPGGGGGGGTPVQPTGTPEPIVTGSPTPIPTPTTPARTVGTIVLHHAFGVPAAQAKPLPPSVSQIVITGYDNTGEVALGPLTYAPQATIEIGSVPVSVVRLGIRYLTATEVYGIFSCSIDLSTADVDLTPDWAYCVKATVVGTAQKVVHVDWAAFQDGTGAWTPISPEDGTYLIPVNDPAGRFGLALVTSDQDSNGESEWHVKSNVMYSTLAETGLTLKVEQGQAGTLAFELPAPPEVTEAAPAQASLAAKTASKTASSQVGTITVSGNVAGMNDVDTGGIYLTSEDTVDFVLNTPYAITTLTRNGLYPVLALKGNGYIPPEVQGGGDTTVEGPINSAIDAMIFGQVAIPEGDSLGVFDVDFTTAQTPVDGRFRLDGTAVDDLVGADVLISSMRDMRVSVGTQDPNCATKVDYKGYPFEEPVPAEGTLAPLPDESTDTAIGLHVFSAVAAGPAGAATQPYRLVEHFFSAPIGTPGSEEGSPQVETLLPTPFGFGAASLTQVTFDKYLDGSEAPIYSATLAVQGPTTAGEVDIAARYAYTRGWLAGLNQTDRYVVDLPDFSTLAGFDPKWVPTTFRSFDIAAHFGNETVPLDMLLSGLYQGVSGMIHKSAGIQSVEATQ
jgi:hypothetical protein